MENENRLPDDTISPPPAAPLPPFPTAPPSPPPLSSNPPEAAPKSGPWSAGWTLGFGVAGMAIMLIIPAIAVLIGMIVGQFQNHAVDLGTYARSGDVVAVSILVTLPAVVGFCVLMAYARRPYPFLEYLGLRSWKGSKLALSLVIWLGFELLAICLEQWAHQPINAEMVAVYRSANHPALLWAAVVVAAPFSEELLFRGFMFTGLAQSKIGWIGATLITTLAWASLHFQYHGLETVELIALGLVLGWLRHRYCSVWITFIVHMINNLAATVCLELYLKGIIQA